jgi:fatty acid desaturase
MAEKLKGLFTPKDLVPFTKQRNGINVIYLLSLYLFGFAIIYFYETYGSPFYILFGFLAMGVIQHNLATFVHEAAHMNLFTNRKMNDFFGHLLCSAPLLSFLKDYRYFHFEHHRHTGKFDKDPELKFYRAMGLKPQYNSPKEVIAVFLNDLSGLSYLRGLIYVLKFFSERRKEGVIEKPNFLENLLVLSWLTVVPYLMWKLGLLVPFVIFWLLPVVTLTPLLLRWHSFGEHIREKLGCASGNTVTHKLSFLTTLFLYPINSSFHLEHHLYPQIPWYSLKDFHLWAGQNPVYRERSQKLTVDGYFLGDKTVLNVAFPIRK